MGRQPFVSMVLWNKRPDELRISQSVYTFKRGLKTNLFSSLILTNYLYLYLHCIVNHLVLHFCTKRAAMWIKFDLIGWRSHAVQHLHNRVRMHRISPVLSVCAQPDASGTKTQVWHRDRTWSGWQGEQDAPAGTSGHNHTLSSAPTHMYRYELLANTQTRVKTHVYSRCSKTETGITLWYKFKCL